LLPVANDFDVYVTASGAETVRRAALARIHQLHPLDGERHASFLSGDRVLLRERLSDGEAQKVATGLRAIGVRVDIEAHRSGIGLAELDSFTSEAPVPKLAATENFLFDINAGLVGLDGADEAPELEPLAPPPRPSGKSGLEGLMGASLTDEDADLTPPPDDFPGAARPAPPPPPPIAATRPPPPTPAPPRPVPKAPPPPVPADQRFAPSGADAGALNLDLDVKPPDPMLSQGKSHRQDSYEVPRCPTHGLPKVGGRCSACDAEERHVAGKLFGGKLRDNPALRIGIGIAAGVVLGWIITSPMAKKGERAVAYIREEADRERARPTEEAQAHARALDQQADDEAQSAFFRTLGVWAVIAAATAGGWHKLT
jgi:hypothetical protein